MAGPSDTSAADDLVGRYLAEIGAYPLLTAASEVELARAIEAGRRAESVLAGAGRRRHGPATAELRQLVAAGDEAKRRFIQSNLRLVVSIAKRYQTSGLALLDLVQEGNLGLMRAVDKFDPARGCRFSTYATWWIREAIAKALADKGRTIRVPMHMLDTVRRVDRSAAGLVERLGRAPTPAEVAADVGLPVVTVLEAQRVVRASVSLSMPVGEDGELADLLEDKQAETPFEQLTAALRTTAVRAALGTLPEREQQVLALRFGLAGGAPCTLEQIGRRFHLTRERIRQIEAKALTRLRHPAGPPGLRVLLEHAHSGGPAATTVGAGAAMARSGRRAPEGHAVS